MKVYLTEHGSFNYTIYDENEAFEMFGYTIEEDLEDFTEIPDDKVKEYKDIYKKFWQLNYELSRDYRK